MEYLTENYLVEQPAINWFKEIGYSYIRGSELIPDNGERESYRHCVLKERFIKAVKRINTWLTDDLAEEVYKKVIESSLTEAMEKRDIWAYGHIKRDGY